MFKTILILSAIALAMSISTPWEEKSNVFVIEATPHMDNLQPQPLPQSNAFLMETTPEKNNLLTQNPQAQPLSREVSEKYEVTVQKRATIRYTVGSRQSGDRLVAHYSAAKSWPSPMDVRLSIPYGPGAIVTCMLIEVNQSSNLGRAYITAGGIGWRSITVVVEANSTLFVDWSYNIYGI